MLSKPKHGWTTVSIGKFRTEASDLVDVPFDWLRACLNGLQHHIPVSLFIEEEGCCSYINSYYDATYIIIDGDDEATVQTYYDIDFFDVTFMLVNDIKAYFEEWVKWYPFEDTNDDYQRRTYELKQLIEQVEQTLHNAANKHKKLLQ